MSRSPDSAVQTRLLTPAGFTDVLRRAGTLTQGSVTALAIDRQIQTSVSNLAFVVVTYSPEAPALPHRLLLKWPLDDTVAPAGGTPELTFYAQLASSLPSPPIVRWLATARSTDEPQWLVLEDLRPTHTNPPWPVLPSPAHVDAAVTVLAQVHARWWESPLLGRTIGSPHTDASLRTMVHGIAAKLPSFLEALGDTLAARDREVLERVFSSSLAPWLRLVEPRALTVIHGDAHPWNFLFPRTGNDPTYVIDWQLWHVDVGARDLAFMLALHWEPARRRAVERSLLRHYHRRLLTAGVTGYSFEDLWLDYRRCLVRNLTFPIIFWSQGLRREAWRRRLDCALGAYRDLDCGQLL